MMLLSHPTGNCFVRALLEGLERDGTEFEFHTTVGLSRDARWPNLLPSSWRDELDRRRFPVAESRLRAHPWREMGRLLRARAGVPTRPGGFNGIDSVYRHLDSCVAHRLATGTDDIDGVYAYEDGAYESFRVAKQAGLPCYYELPIAYWETSRRLLHEEAQRWPEWKDTLGAPADSAAKLERKTEELAAADVVICPSEFVLRTLPASIRETKPCVIAEFGSPTISSEALPRRAKGKLRLLFAGTLTQRKGLADLFAAMHLLERPDVELVAMGSLLLPREFYERQWSGLIHESPRAHSEVLALMRTCDVLVLPSIVEGRALVQQEALSCGLPLLITPNTGGTDLVTAGETGFVVPIRQPEALAEKIDWFADHRLQLEEMRAAAQARAREFTWKRYAERILAHVTRLVGAGVTRL